MEVLAFVLVLFVALPFALGFLVPSAGVARAVWLVVGAVLAYSQSTDEALGGAWVVVAIVVVVDLLLVQLGHYLRTRRPAKA